MQSERKTEGKTEEQTKDTTHYFCEAEIPVLCLLVCFCLYFTIFLDSWPISRCSPFSAVSSKGSSSLNSITMSLPPNRKYPR